MSGISKFFFFFFRNTGNGTEQPGFVVVFLFCFVYFYFWLHWVFVAARGLSPVAVSGATLPCSTRASHLGGFSCCGARALGTRASVVVAHGLSSCGTRA